MSILSDEVWRAWRATLRRPAFLLLAATVLALGVGASTAAFSLVDKVVLRPLPFAQPQRLIAMGVVWNGAVEALSPQQFQHIEHVEGIEPPGLVERFSPPVNVAGDGPPIQAEAIYANRNLLPTLAVRMAAGRNFSAAEDSRGGPPAVILSHALWMSRFGGDRAAIGQTLSVEGRPYTIVGVLPAGLGWIRGDIMLPTALAAHSRNDGTNYLAVARLKPGASVAAVSAEVDTRLHTFYASQDPSSPYIKMLQRMHFGAQPLHTALTADSLPVLGLFLASAVFVLLIALVNLTNLMLLRTLARTHDAAVRAALGASTWRLAVPSLAEGLLVGVAGAVAGVGLAAAGLALAKRLMPAGWVARGVAQMSASMWWLALAVGLFGALLAALLGVWRGRRRSGSIEELREGGRSGLGVQSGRFGRALVVVQVALATALLGAAGLFLHTLYDATHASLGFDGHDIVTFELAPVKATYADSKQVETLSRRVLDSLRAQPGVVDATVTTNLPTGTFTDQFNLGGFHPPGTQGFSVQFRGVAPNFFHLFGIRMLRGRAFDAQDTAGGERVVIVSRSLAEHRYGGHALGKTIIHDRGPGAPSWTARIVGVADDTHQYGALTAPRDTLYLPLAQMPDDELRIFRSFSPLRFALAVHGDPAAYAAAIRRAVHDVAPQQPIAHVRTMRHVIAQTNAEARTDLILVGLFAALALLLAGVGMYAVMAVAVAAREREFGVRSAMGASPARLARLVLHGAMVQVGFGLVLGGLLALSMSGVLRAALSQLGRAAIVDPLDMAGVAIVLLVAGLLACLLPAWRAGRVHPMRALRGE